MILMRQLNPRKRLLRKEVKAETKYESFIADGMPVSWRTCTSAWVDIPDDLDGVLYIFEKDLVDECSRESSSGPGVVFTSLTWAC